MDNMAWASVSLFIHIHGQVEDVHVNVLDEVVVDGTVVEEGEGEDVVDHMLVKRLLFVKEDMIYCTDRQKR